MELEDQVVSLELAKKLKELGVEQESYFIWIKQIPYNTWHVGNEHEITCRYDKNEIYSAFTVAELGEMLPAVWTTKSDGKFLCSYEYEKYQMLRCEEKTEADARSKILIHLIEKGLVKFK